jgi:hypothetical protein
MLPSVDNVVMTWSSFSNDKNTLQVRGFTQINAEEDIIKKECYIEESDKTLINIIRWKLPSLFSAGVKFKYWDWQFTKQ